jgi:hypothetical protein
VLVGVKVSIEVRFQLGCWIAPDVWYSARCTFTNLCFQIHFQLCNVRETALSQSYGNSTRTDIDMVVQQHEASLFVSYSGVWQFQKIVKPILSVQDPHRHGRTRVGRLPGNSTGFGRLQMLVSASGSMRTKKHQVVGSLGTYIIPQILLSYNLWFQTRV